MVLKCQVPPSHKLKINFIIKKENLVFINNIKRRITKNFKIIINTKIKKKDKKKEVKCFKCVKIGYIPPNCKKNKN